MYRHDNRVVMTLDAGGTNFVFSAICGNQEVITPIRYASNADDLTACLATIVKGFSEVRNLLDASPVAISFAFPGPADYASGVIGDLPNFPSFRGGVPLGAFLENEFKIPVFINNDGNLFAYGEAIAGLLPEVNGALQESGSSRRYRNLLGFTLGTGFGAGVVVGNQLLHGDNGCGGDVWCFRNKINQELIVEENVSIRAVSYQYAQYSGNVSEVLTPYEIFQIAEGEKNGDTDAAKRSFALLGEVAGDIIAQAVTLIDGIVVIGGGLSGAAKYFMPALLSEMNRNFSKRDGESFPRMQVIVYDFDDPSARGKFLEAKSKRVVIPNSAGATTSYNFVREVVIAISKLGTSNAIALGAYAYALAQLDNRSISVFSCDVCT